MEPPEGGDYEHLAAALSRDRKEHLMNPALTASLILLATSLTVGETVLHVAPVGNDKAAGTIEAPLATLTGARDRVRQLKEEGGPVTVVFAAGTYSFDQPVAFKEEDSGTPEARIAYRAAPEAAVRFTGGRAVEKWSPLEDESVLKRLAPEARGKVLVADLKAQGLTDFGKLAVRGFAIRSPVAEAELFYDDVPMTLARWPNQGFMRTKGKKAIHQVVVDTDRIARWIDEPEPWLFAYWYHDWAEVYEPLEGVDPAQKLLLRSQSIKPKYGINPRRARWYALNLLSELDTPGEYYLDRRDGKLYFWPPEENGRAVLSRVEGLIRGENLSHVTFAGFTIECCRATAVSIRGGAECHVVGCTIRNAGHRGVSVGGGEKHEVYGCDVYDCGEGGIAMWAGDRRRLIPARHNAENNHVYRYSRRARTYKTGITVGGVGNRIAHNLIHDGPHMALSACGNDHVVEYNEIHNVVYESGDAGAYYVGRDWTARGNVLRFNYWHQIVGATGHGGMTIYLDDQHCGHTIHGNLFERCSRAVFIGGGDDNVVTNNVFIDCWRAAHLDNRGMGWQKKATDDPKGTLRTRLRSMPYQSDLWKKRYPTLVNILEDDPNVPKRNLFARNISAGGTWDDIHRGTRKYQTVEKNLARDQDKSFVRLVKDDQGRPAGLKFKDPDAVAAIGFEALPLEKMGLYEDERRASWPVHHEVRPVELPETPKPPKPKPQANLPPDPTFTVPRDTVSVRIDGTLEAAEWSGLKKDEAMVLKAGYQGALVEAPAHAWLSHDGRSLRVAMTAPLPKKRSLGTQWGGNEAVEVAFRAADGPNAETLVLRGYTNSKWETCADAGAGQQALGRLKKGVQYGAKVTADTWSAEWSVPLANLGVVPADRLRFNLTVRRTAGNLWIMWRPTRGNSYLVERVGSIELAR